MLVGERNRFAVTLPDEVVSSVPVDRYGKSISISIIFCLAQRTIAVKLRIKHRIVFYRNNRFALKSLLKADLLDHTE